MKWYSADLHIHSVLSPCGDLDMSPARIISKAKEKRIDIIGISDHNSTLHAELLIELGKKEGIVVFPGAEVTSREEVHCLAFFENIEKTKQFQRFLEDKSSGIANNPNKFGQQILVNELEEVVSEVSELLILGLDASINDIEKTVHNLNGVFIPAHVDKASNSIYSQIGFIPNDIQIDAIECSSNCSIDNLLRKRTELKNYSIITNSDAHYPHQLGNAVTEYYLEQPTFSEWKMALTSINGRRIRIK